IAAVAEAASAGPTIAAVAGAGGTRAAIAAVSARRLIGVRAAPFATGLLGHRRSAGQADDQQTDD
ncbi:MAG TPA: hypothetical protein PLV57_05180, partial [Phycisphaerae bacterium]|nr:hypothetical protein [Phycisphaerae bacterium]